ncbi:MAG: LTA synthase family protein [Myxococcales bacterium]|nr:LTA synthase family protein [Myxococcales bacterium]
MRRIAILVAAAAGPPLLVRAALLASETGTGASLGVGTLGAVLSDLDIALLAAALLAALLQRSRAAAVVVALLWGLVHYAQYEHAFELDSNLRLATARYLGDPTFFTGSAMTPSRPGLLATLALGPCLLVGFAQRARKPASWLAPLGAGIVLLGVLTATAIPPDRTGWRELHFAHEALFALSDTADPAGASTDDPLAEYRADLAGTPLAFVGDESVRRGTNVLLVVLEGVTGAYIEPSAAAHGVTAPFNMPGLSEIARRNVVATSFISQQRQTNRGLYALLCGDYPKLGSQLARMTEYLDGGTRRCLPRVLGALGYTSVYMQSAPLDFMFKGAFMEQIGFDRVVGDRHFENPDVRTNWGVDDGTLFRRALELIDERDQEGVPWFVTLLTVGTHHPYILPPDRELEDEDDRLEAAFAWLDDRVSAFIAALDRRGVLDDTLVLITVDESRGTRTAGGPVARLLHQSWGTFIALLPSRPAFAIDAPFAQSDVALSIVDYLGIAPSSTPFIGRSVFRAYDTPRRVFFSNTHKRRTGAIFGSDTIYVCSESVSQCEKYTAPAAGLFGGEPTPAEFEPGEFTDPGAVVARSLGGLDAARSDLSFQLASTESLPIWGIENQRILDGQNLFVPPNSRIEVEIDLALVGAAGHVELHHVLDDNHENTLAEPELARLYAGETLSIRYAVETRSAVENLKCRLKVKDSDGEELRLRIDRAVLRISPAQDPEATGGNAG